MSRDVGTGMFFKNAVPPCQRPESIVLIGMSMGGYLAPRAAAFVPRIDGVVTYDVMYSLQEAMLRDAPSFFETMRRIGLDGLVNASPARQRASTRRCAGVWATRAGYSEAPVSRG